MFACATAMRNAATLKRRRRRRFQLTLSQRYALARHAYAADAVFFFAFCDDLDATHAACHAMSPMHAYAIRGAPRCRRTPRGVMYAGPLFVCLTHAICCRRRAARSRHDTARALCYTNSF